MVSNIWLIYEFCLFHVQMTDHRRAVAGLLVKPQQLCLGFI